MGMERMDLTIVMPDGKRRIALVEGDRVTIGRRADCDIRIDSQAVSRLHAELVRLDDDGWELRDLGSTNGIEVEGRLVDRWRPHEGDEIHIGDARMYVGAAPVDDSTVIISRKRPQSGLWLDADHRVLRRGDVALGDRLAPREYALLRLLADAKGHVVERRTLEEALWGANAYDDNALHQLVRRTREKIGDDASSPSILLTLPGVGYRLDLDSTG
jgi:DNA-binding winged helix-turn-helix (wHTH) protein